MLAQWVEQRFSHPERGFGPARAEERTVWGARRPGFPLPRVSRAAVNRWTAFMQREGIGRVVCLLSTHQLRAYDDLLAAYRAAFGAERVLWTPIPDFHLADEAALTQRILPFLFAAEAEGERAVVHCSGGIGRTGQVLAAWLVSARGLSNAEAIATVRRNGRNAEESRDPRLAARLDRCRAAFQ